MILKKVEKIFNSKVILDKADLVLVELQDKNYFVCKCRGGAFSPHNIINEAQFRMLLKSSLRPLVLHESYL